MLKKILESSSSYSLRYDIPLTSYATIFLWMVQHSELFYLSWFLLTSLVMVSCVLVLILDYFMWMDNVSYIQFFLVRKAKPLEKLEAVYRTFLRRSTKKREQEVCYLNDSSVYLGTNISVEWILSFFYSRTIQQMMICQNAVSGLTWNEMKTVSLFSFTLI